MDKQFTVIGMIPVEERSKCRCAFCGTRKSVKYKLVLLEDERAVPWFCCNRCVLTFASFYRTDVPIDQIEKVPAFLFGKES